MFSGVNGQPGGPVNTLVVTLQGDRLDPASAEDANNYRVTWLGADGIAGTADDQLIPLGATGGGQSVVYAPGANTGPSSGITYPTAVRQTVTLFFANALPVNRTHTKTIAKADLNEDVGLDEIRAAVTLTPQPPVAVFRESNQVTGNF